VFSLELFLKATSTFEGKAGAILELKFYNTGLRFYDINNAERSTPFGYASALFPSIMLYRNIFWGQTV
jgi:hypothetical protein